LSPEDVREEFLAGHAALAVAWPGHAVMSERSRDTPCPTGFAELPGSSEVYNFASQSWETRSKDEANRVPLLGVAGRLGSVAQQSSHPADAFQLLAWLAGTEWGTQISVASTATTLYRQSQLRAPARWVDKGTDIHAAGQYAATVRDALSRQAHLFALRIPGHERYLAALDDAVAQALGAEKSAADALAEAAAEWKAITEQLGVDAQRKAYCRSLGIEP
jgi:multiple sugar transport system substrate-binding protein